MPWGIREPEVIWYSWDRGCKVEGWLWRSRGQVGGPVCPSTELGLYPAGDQDRGSDSMCILEHSP